MSTPVATAITIRSAVITITTTTTIITTTNISTSVMPLDTVIITT